MMELQKKMKRNNLILTKANKENKIVVMDRGDYTKEVESYMMENGYQLIDNDPTEGYQTSNKVY